MTTLTLALWLAALIGLACCTIGYQYELDALHTFGLMVSAITACIALVLVTLA